MQPNTRTTSPLAAATVAALFLAAGFIVADSGCSDSSLRVQDLDGKPFNLQKASEGRVHVAVFTRSDCPISNRFAPEVRSLCDNFRSKGVAFYLIYVDPNEKPDAIRDHLRQYEY